MHRSIENVEDSGPAESAEVSFLIERNADGILVVDEDNGTVQFANPAAAETFGRSEAQLQGAALGLPLVAGETTEIEIHRPQGCVEVEMRTVTTTWNGRPALLASLRDVSERRRLEEALRQSQKLEAIGRLTAGVAHDFNNLLTVILGNLEITERRLSTDPAHVRIPVAVSHAIEAARRAAQLTHQLLAYSRRQPLAPKSIQANELIGATLGLVTRTIGEGVRIEIDLDPSLWPIRIDPAQLQSALINLSVNARDAMDGVGVLTIRTRRCDGVRLQDQKLAGEFVCIEVCDDGSGITEEVKAQIFDPFFTTKDVGKGTGLGLSQVYGFVKQSGGYITIDSTVGRGTIVSLYLPHDKDVTETVDDTPPIARSVQRASRRVLLVEDDAGVRAYARQILVEAGFNVVEAVDGRQARDLLTGVEPIDILFTDLSLPGDIDGRQLAEIARRSFPKIAVLITTGYAGEKLLKGGEVDDIATLLPKPYTAGQLVAALEAENRPSPLILVVEDDKMVHEVLEDTLRDAGCRLVQARNSREALAHLQRERRFLDAAVVDLGLPDGKGVAVLDSFRAKCPAGALVVASGYVDDALFERSENDPRMVVLEKPFDGAALLDILLKLGLDISHPASSLGEV